MRIVFNPLVDDDKVVVEFHYKPDEWSTIEKIYRQAGMTKSTCHDCLYKVFYDYADRGVADYFRDAVRREIAEDVVYIVDDMYRPVIRSQVINLVAFRAVPTCSSDGCTASFRQYSDMIYMPVLYYLPKVLGVFLKTLVVSSKIATTRFVISVVPAP
jgi:hypothetical protein